MKKILLALALVLFSSAAQAQAPQRWAVYYGSALEASAFDSFDMVVFDSDQHPPLEPLKQKGKVILGYLSLGEAEDYRPYYKELKKQGLLIAPNDQWKGHHVIDMRKPEWEKMVLDTLIPAILAQGFDGIMLDTIDSPLHLENIDPKQFGGMKQASVTLIQKIRSRFKETNIMLNRGFELLPDVALSIDMSLAESTRADMSTKGKVAKLVPDKQYAEYVAMLKTAQAISPTLFIYTLDYWNMSDTKGVKRIYNEQRSYGFYPYVSTLSLQKVYPEPK